MSRIFSSRRATFAASSTTTDVPKATPRRSRRALLIRIVTLVALVAVVGAFLEVVARNATTTTNASEKPVRGGSIVDGMNLEPDSLLPNRYIVWAPAPVVGSALWASLWYFDSQGILRPGIATAVPTPTDLKTLTFQLRPGLKWSDGAPETADDCVFSFNLYANPAYGNTFGFPTTDPSDPVGFESATKVDNLTVRLSFKHPRGGMLYALVDSPGTCLQKAHYSTDRASRLRQVEREYRAAGHQRPLQVQRMGTRRPHHARAQPLLLSGPDKPYLDQITFKFITDSARMLAALQSHLVDTSWALDFTQLAALRATPGDTTYLDRYPQGVEYLFFNLTDPILADHAVRQALTMSFDIKQLPQQLFDGAAQLTCDDATGTFAHEPNLIPCYHYDPQRRGTIARCRRLGDGRGWLSPQERPDARPHVPYECRFPCAR